MDIRLTNNKHNVTITNIEHITNIDIYDGDIVIEYGKSCTFEIDADVFDFNDIINQLNAHMDILTEELVDNLILMNDFDETDFDYTDADIIAITGEVPDCIADEYKQPLYKLLTSQLDANISEITLTVFTDDTDIEIYSGKANLYPYEYDTPIADYNIYNIGDKVYMDVWGVFPKWRDIEI